MSAADPVTQTSAAPDQKLYEPSMEEILASIRRIIADDQSLPGRPSISEEEDRLRAVLTAPEAQPEAEPLRQPAREPAPTVRAIFASHPVAPEPRPAAVAQTMPPAAQVPVAPMPVAPMPVAQVPEAEVSPIRTLSPSNPQAPVSPAIGSPEAASPLPEAPTAASVTIVAPPMPEARIAAPQYAMPDTPAAPPQPSTVEAASPEPPVPAPVAAAPVSPAETPRADAADDHRHAPVRTAAPPETSLFSPGTGSSVTAAFNTLAATRLIENDAALNEMARDMLRPMLKDWLDDNLPVLVERLVRAEIERVGRGGR